MRQYFFWLRVLIGKVTIFATVALVHLGIISFSNALTSFEIELLIPFHWSLDDLFPFLGLMPFSLEARKFLKIGLNNKCMSI